MEESAYFDKTTLIFLIPEVTIKKVIVFNESQIHNLQKVYQTKNNCLYFYKGITLNPKLKFKEYGFSNDDIIICKEIIPNKTKDHATNFLKLSENIVFLDKVRILTNKETKRELFRLKDIRSLKMEGNRNMYRKMIHKAYLFNEKKKKQSGEKLDFKTDLGANYKPLEMPSTDAMPILW